MGARVNDDYDDWDDDDDWVSEEETIRDTVNWLNKFGIDVSEEDIATAIAEIDAEADVEELPDWEKDLFGADNECDCDDCEEDRAEEAAAEEAKQQEQESGEVMSGYTQWSRVGHLITPVGDTFSTMDPGYYDIILNQQGLFFEPVKPREDPLLQFPDSATDRVMKGIETFWEREAQFARYEIPFKRGILLHGPPGTGKTCTLGLVARDVIARDGIVLNMVDNPAAFLQAYRAIRDIQPKMPIVVLMEDFDAMIKKAGTGESKLLNLLDGVEQLQKIVFLATTNYPEQLDQRIINRPSRFDLHIEVGLPGAESRRIYLKSLLHEDDADLDIDSYIHDTEGMSLAHLKELFVSTHILGADYKESLHRLVAMHADTPHSKDSAPDAAKIKANYGGPIRRARSAPGQYI